MAGWDDVARLALGLPDTAEKTSYGRPGWAVAGKVLAWERPLGTADRAALGDAAPDAPPLGVRTPDLGAKEALLADDPAAFFTTPHFDGHPSVLVRVEAVDVEVLEEVLVDAWLARAPKRAAAAFTRDRPGPRSDGPPTR